ncbi:MAG: hypothetical protein P4M13_02640 [Alphaproteobacteria bacterium]|nr:hypothetical protein [Alphaproteobacteria bacterium]
MQDDQILANYFFIKTRGLQIFRVQRRGSATILWTSRTAVLRYLQDLQDAILQGNSQHG